MTAYDMESEPRYIGHKAQEGGGILRQAVLYEHYCGWGVLFLHVSHLIITPPSGLVLLVTFSRFAFINSNVVGDFE
jgi:hypothetical protein